MKKYNVIILLVLEPIIAQSQDYSNYGFKFGLVSAKAELDIEPNNSHAGLDNWFKNNRIGVTFGIFINLFTTDYFDVQSELSYYEEGAQDEISVTSINDPTGNGEYIVYDHEYDFLKFYINTHLKYKLNNITPYLIVGPSVNYLLNDRGEFYLEDLKKFHFGYSFGLGITIDNIFNNSFFCEFKNNRFFKDFADTDRAKLELSSWQINFGMLL